jgi:hypothetical protein
METTIITGKTYFNITSVSRDDLVGLNGFTEEDVAKISDAKMDKLASQMANDYLEQLYWSSLEILSEDILEDE